MNAFYTECLDIVSKNLFAIQKLYGMNKWIIVYKCDEDGIRIFIEGEFEKTILPNRISLGVKEFYDSIFKRDFEENVDIDCKYDYDKERLELYIRKLVVDRVKKYILKIDGGDCYDNCRWELRVKNEDLEKIKYLTEISEESTKRFGNSSSLDLSLNVTNEFIPEDECYYGEPFGIDSSKLLYVGNNKFVVSCNFTRFWEEQYTIITEKFEI